jgi:hypothetical protein
VASERRGRRQHRDASPTKSWPIRWSPWTVSSASGVIYATFQWTEVC